jgi:peptide/nickel transport system permease protein
LPAEYIAKRLLQTVLVILGVTTITFVLTHVIPGDPAILMLGDRTDAEVAAKIRHELGLDKNMLTQYFDFLGNMAQFKFGKSYFTNKNVLETVINSFSVTCQISLISVLVSLVFGILTGVLSSVNRGKWLDVFLMSAAIVFISAPSFWIAIILQIIFGFKLRWFPITGTKSLVLPCTVLGIRLAANTARFTRTSMIDILNQEYIKTARAKGLSKFDVIFSHALKNALIPIITLTGMQLGGLMTGSMLVETVFSIPGIGRLTVNSILSRDLPMLQGCVVYIAVIFAIINLVIDLLYQIANPRIRIDSLREN